MQRFFAGLTDPGLLRTSNQDAYHLDDLGRFFVVADGMGGHAGGQEASRLATEAIYQYLDNHWDSSESPDVMLRKAFIAANDAILKDQYSHPERADMGTTAVAVMFWGPQNQPWCAHVGDSRLYRLRGAKLDQITTDHTWVAKAIEDGELTVDESKHHPWRHVLSQCLGREDLNRIDIQSLDILGGDRLLLCSDGLTEELSDPLIATHLKSIRSCPTAVESLIDAAKQRGGRDNITVVVVAFQD
ncbi:MAG: protein phosphatase 2C domain-containing protein [Cyanobacteria bacterium P01_D01_bin.56]